MTSSEQDPDGVDLGALGDAFIARIRSGERLTVEAFAAEYPSVRAELHEVLPAMLAMERLKDGRLGELAASTHPEQLGDFRIVREIGRGGMGIVFEAEQLSLGRFVALKVLPRAMLLDSDRIERFHREASAAARLHHTNIVPVFGVGQADGYHYYAMQRIDGVGLDAIISRLAPSGGGNPPSRGGSLPESSQGEPLPDESSFAANAARPSDIHPVAATMAAWLEDPKERPLRAAEWVAQAAEALHYAHRQGVLHRDVKPSNLLIDGDRNLWLADFGLAKVLIDDEVSRSALPVGTPRYMAPEQLDGHFDARGDVHGLGLTLYELLTLRPAFDAQSSDTLLNAIRSELPPRPRRIARTIPHDLETIVLKSIAKEPAERYSTAADLAADLRRFMDGRPVLARRVSVFGQAVRMYRRNKALTTLGAVATAALLLAAVLLWIDSRRSRNALVLEGQRAAELQIVSDRAEANLALAMEGFEGVFESLIGPDPSGRRVDPDSNESWASTSVSEQDAQLLHRLLGFYERFAKANGPHPELQRRSVAAYRRVGDIQLRLGNLDDATAAYQAALQRADRMANADARAQLGDALLRAQLHNALGRIETERGRLPQARQEHRAALEVLDACKASAAESAEYCYQFADSLDQLGSVVHAEVRRRNRGPGSGGGAGPDGRPRRPGARRGPGAGRPRGPGRGRGPGRSRGPGSGQGPRPGRPRPGAGRPGAGGRGGDGPRGELRSAELMPGHKLHTQALDWIDRALGKQPRSVAYRLVRGRVLRHLARLSLNAGDPDAGFALLEQAKVHCRELVDEQPEFAPAQFELVETLLLPRAMGPAHVVNQLRAWYADAVEIAEQLVAGHPSVPRYGVALVRALDRIATIQHAADEVDSAEKNWSQAAEHGRALLARTTKRGALPDVRTVDDFVRLANKLARTRMRAGKRAEAKAGIQAILPTLEAVYGRLAEQHDAHLPSERRVDRLRRAIDGLGELAAADR